MTRRDSNLSDIVRSWLREDRGEDAERLLFSVFDQLETTPQRRVGWLARMLGGANRKSVLYSVAAAIVAVAALLGSNVLPRDLGARPTPTPAPTPIPSTLPIEWGTDLDPGVYRLDRFPATMVFEVSPEFTSCSSSPGEQGVCTQPSGVGQEVSVSFLDVRNVVADPCTGQERDPPLGDSIDDLIAAITALEGFSATPAVNVSIDGFHGRRFTLTAPENPRRGCELQTWVMPERTNGVGAGEVNDLLVLDVRGERVMVAVAYFPGETDAEALARARGIVDSISIE